MFTKTANAERTILFPILGGGKYSNDFLASRASGTHHATDIFANKHTPLVAAVDGTITFAPYPQPSYGYMITITDADGYKYNYIHINNDNPGTDDGQGGGMHAYAPDMMRNNKVVKGQLIGYVGDSGNAETTPPHLHFEIYRPDGSPVNPYDELINAPIKHDINPIDYPELSTETLPYGPVKTGVSVAIGDFDIDVDSEVVTGAGAGGGPHIKVFEDDMTFNGVQFMAYSPQFLGGVEVAAGDVDGDGKDELITGAGPGGGPHVKIFKADGTEIGGFYAYAPSHTGGVNVAAGDIDGDGKDEIITGPGTGGGPHVRIFKANGVEVVGFFPFEPTFTGGVDVAAGDLVGDTKEEVVLSAGPSGGPRVRILSYTTQVQYLNDFYAYDANYRGGVRISVGNVQESSVKSEILTAPYSNGGPHIQMFSANGTLIRGKMYMEGWWNGSYDIAAGDGFSLVGTGTNRRATIRDAF